MVQNDMMTKIPTRVLRRKENTKQETVFAGCTDFDEK
jgi:hypothetical protein